MQFKYSDGSLLFFRYLGKTSVICVIVDIIIIIIIIVVVAFIIIIIIIIIIRQNHHTNRCISITTAPRLPYKTVLSQVFGQRTEQTV